ncbi:MAG TPA: PAS domain-containing protein [Longimicrobium sp.]|uniref:PAS domain-containing protein n=1 Tax=Longimicrobium sp. TaxID=2029185 RepID=UPI002EDB29C3
MSTQDGANGSADAEALFAGGGEMRARCRALDWASTPLGPVEAWPAALRLAVRTAMDSPFPINLWCGPELVLVYNDGYAPVLGAKDPAALGRPGREVWGEIWGQVAPMFNQIRAGGPPVYAEDAPFVIERAGAGEAESAPGEPNAWFTFALSPVRDEDGTIVAFLNVVSETTARLMAERATRAARADAEQAEARLREVFLQAPAAILITEGPEHVPTVVNARYTGMVGPRQLLGRPLREGFPDLEGQPFFALMDRVYASGEPFVGTEMPVQLDRRGTGEMEDGCFNFVYQPLTGADGQVFGIMTHAVEVTAQVRARREIEATAAERSAILRQIADGVVMADAEGRISFVNEAGQRILGMAGLGTQVDDYSGTFRVLTPEGEPFPNDELPLVRAVKRGETVLGVEWVSVHPDGTRALVQGSAAPVLATDGQTLGAVVTMRDVTEERRLQKQLEADRGRLAAIFQNAPAFIATLRGPEHVFEITNPLYQQLIGHRDVIGRRVVDALPEVVEQGFIGLLDGVYRTGEPFVGDELPILLQTEPGSPPRQRFLNFVYQPVREADGAISGIFVHGVDVTDQVHARQHVERLEERLRLALESADIGTWDFDPVSGALSWDERCRRIFGMPAEGEVHYDDFLRHLHPDDLDRANAAVARALDPAGAGDYEADYTVIPAGGEVRWIRASGRAAFGQVQGERRAVRFTGTVIDVTDRARAEAERERLLREAETQRSRLEQIFAEAPAVMALYTGPEHTVTLVNPSWEQTVGKPDAVGRTFRDVFPEFEGSGLFELLEWVYHTGEPFVDPEVNVPLERFGSGVLEDTYWHLVWRPLASADPDRRDILVHAVEVTTQVRARRDVEQKAEELARLARALEASNRELDQFAYVASHDLKAPLRGISNLSQWIEDDLADRFTDDAREQMRLLRGRVTRMEGLIDGILQYSRAGRVQEQPERVDVGALARDVVDLLAPPDGVTVEVQPGMPVLFTERLPMQQVLMNLVGNAIKYGPEGGTRVTVSARDADGGWEFAVADNGPGVPAQYHDRIFGLFQTLESRDKVEGTGIGLSIVKKMVESRGGRVWVESPPGGGATFRFTWPASPSTDGEG